jgi:hypothetical protein
LEYGLIQPVAVLLDGQHLALPRRRFGGRAVEGAAPVLRKRYVLSERIEECEDLLGRIVDTGLGLLDPLPECFVAPAEVGGYQFVLPAENVEGAFGDSRLLDAITLGYQTELSEDCRHGSPLQPLVLGVLRTIACHTSP